MSTRDPLHELRDAWSRLTPPDPLQQHDPLGARATANVRAAWKRLEAPAARVPAELAARTPRSAPQLDAVLEIEARRAPRPAARRVAHAARWALAAGLAGVALYGAWKSALAPRARTLPSAAVVPSLIAAQAPRAPRSVPIAALTSNSMELRSGNVRLTLFTPTKNRTSAKETPR